MEQPNQKANFTHGMSYIAYFLIAQSFGIFDFIRSIIPMGG